MKQASVMSELASTCQATHSFTIINITYDIVGMPKYGMVNKYPLTWLHRLPVLHLSPAQ